MAHALINTIRGIAIAGAAWLAMGAATARAFEVSGFQFNDLHFSSSPPPSNNYHPFNGNNVQNGSSPPPPPKETFHAYTPEELAQQNRANIVRYQQALSLIKPTGQDGSGLGWVLPAGSLEPSGEQAQQVVRGQVDRINNFERGLYNSQLEKMMGEIDHIAVPPPYTRHPVDEVVILGLFDTQKDAEKTLVGAKSPFSDKPLNKDQIFSTAGPKGIQELIRGLLDHRETGEETLDSENGRELIARLNGALVHRLIAHSNGAMVAEALIRRDVIAVDELDIVGGDRSLLNQAGFQDLVSSGRVKHVVVWLNPGDIVPLWSSNVMANLPPFGSLSPELASEAQHLAAVSLGLHENQGTVEYRYLAGPSYNGQRISLSAAFLNPHYLTTYFSNITEFLGKGGAGQESATKPTEGP